MLDLVTYLMGEPCVSAAQLSGGFADVYRPFVGKEGLKRVKVLQAHFGVTTIVRSSV